MENPQKSRRWLEIFKNGTFLVLFVLVLLAISLVTMIGILFTASVFFIWAFFRGGTDYCLGYFTNSWKSMIGSKLNRWFSNGLPIVCVVGSIEIVISLIVCLVISSVHSNINKQIETPIANTNQKQVEISEPQPAGASDNITSAGWQWVNNDYLPNHVDQPEWTKLSIDKRTELEQRKLKQMLLAVDPYICWIAKELNWPVNLVRGLVLLESGGNVRAIDSVFASGQSNCSHVGFGQMSLGNIIRILRIPSAQARSLRLLEQDLQVACQNNLWNRVTKETFKKQLDQFTKFDPRFNPALAAMATKSMLADNQRVAGEDQILAVQAYHNGLGNLAKLIKAYGDYTESYKLTYSPNSVSQIYRAIKQGIASGFSYEKFWKEFKTNPEFASAVAELGLNDNAETYAFKALALKELLDDWITDQPLNNQVIDVDAQIAKAQSELAQIAYSSQLPSWFRSDLMIQRPAVRNEKALKAELSGFGSWQDLASGLQKGRLVKIETNSQIGLYVDKSLGAKAKNELVPYYRVADKQLWATLTELATRWSKNGGAAWYITSTVRTKAYERLMGLDHFTAHVGGRAVDIVLERGRPAWRWVDGEKFFAFLRQHAAEGGFNFYTEATDNRCHIHLFRYK